MSHTYDVLISGAGPAGVVLAMHLHKAGLDVLLCGRPRRFDSLEGMPERGKQALHVAGCKQALACLGPSVSRQAIWSGKAFGGNQEYLVQRSLFDSALWQDAQNAGVTMLRTRVGRVSWQQNQWHASLVGHDGVTARYWVEARGRQAPAPLSATSTTSTPTMAVSSTTPSAVLRQQAPPVFGVGGWWDGPSNKPAAGITPFEDGWCWYARLQDGRTQLQLFVDALAQRPPSRAQLRTYYLALVQRCSAASELIKDSTLTHSPFVRSAELTYSDPMPVPFHARTGDAALALDPLAGHGMFEAMALAMTLACCVRTQIERPADSDMARSFYRDRVMDEFLRLARTGRDFYRLETQWPLNHFWSSRQDWPDTVPSHPSLVLGDGKIETKPVSVNGFIEQRQVVTCPDAPRGVWLVGGVPLVDVLEQIRQCGVPRRAELAAFAAQGGWPMQSVGAAITWLAQRELLMLAI